MDEIFFICEYDEIRSNPIPVGRNSKNFTFRREYRDFYKAREDPDNLVIKRYDTYKFEEILF